MALRFALDLLLVVQAECFKKCGVILQSSSLAARVHSRQGVAPGFAHMLPAAAGCPQLRLDAEALKKYTTAQEGHDLRATCDLVPPVYNNIALCCPAASTFLITTVMSTDQFVQIDKFQTEHGVTLPATVRLQGTDLVLPLHRVVTFTGDRFLRSVSLPTDSNGESSEPEGLHFPEADLEIAKAVFSMMMDSPPESVTVEQLGGVLRMCQFCLADTLLSGFPAYLKGAVCSCTSHAVCSLLSRVWAFDVLSLPFLFEE